MTSAERAELVDIAVEVMAKLTQHSDEFTPLQIQRIAIALQAMARDAKARMQALRELRDDA